MNNLAPMKNCPGGGGCVQGNLNWMPGYYTHTKMLIRLLMHRLVSFFAVPTDFHVIGLIQPLKQNSCMGICCAKVFEAAKSMFKFFTLNA